ncbi:MAG TPA: retroviral-like aspartic protease family protein [Solirubrobacteraceae bacterium]|nr:retroviral-like aspartic protease family protein [Solirubrobacteraceae bacterium]
MRRFIVVGLLCGVASVGVTEGVASASPIEAHAAQATVPIVVVKTRSGATAALVRVYIHGRLIPMLIDTGATVTVINQTAARHLHLKTVGKRHRFCGVTGCALASHVRVSNWNVNGTVPLPTVVVSSSPIAGLNAHGFGLLGSDVLSRFGSVTINYAAKTLTLG